MLALPCQLYSIDIYGFLVMRVGEHLGTDAERPSSSGG